MCVIYKIFVNMGKLKSQMGERAREKIHSKKFGRMGLGTPCTDLF